MSEGAEYDFELAESLIQAKVYARLVEYARPFAEAGVSDAECLMGVLYQCGMGVPVDAAEAERWFMSAAEKRNPVAWINLGNLYAVSDPQKGKDVHRRAVELGILPTWVLEKIGG